MDTEQNSGTDTGLNQSANPEQPDNFNTQTEQVENINNSITEESSPEKSWQEDGRYEKLWNKDPNALFKSYKELETKLQANGSRISDYEKKLETLNTEVDNYNNFKKYLDSIQNHPEYSSKFSALVDEYNKELRRQQYGADLPDHIVEKLQEVDNLKQYVENYENEKKLKEQSKIVDSQLEQIDDIAKKHNIEFDKNQFMAWCLENQVKPRDMSAYFIKEAFDHIKGNITHKTQENTLNNIKKNSKASLNIGTKKSGQNTNSTMSLEDQMRAILS